MEFNGAIIVIKDIALSILGIGVTVFVAKSDKRWEKVWKWLENHGHIVECNNSVCKPKTTGVITPHNGR